MMTDALNGEEIVYPAPDCRVIVAASLPEFRFVVNALSVTLAAAAPVGIVTWR
jgi:hypothetical protein